MGSLKKNFVYSSLLTTANFIFPLLTFPYVSRVLGANNIGIVNFVDSIISYFVLFSMLGVGTIGIREVASSRTNKKDLSNVFSSLLTLTGILTAISIVTLFICTLFLPQLSDKREVCLLGGFKLAFSFLLVEWFYKGLEEFRYITIRTLIIKSIYVAFVFIFVRKSEDYNIYYLLTILMVVINAVVNIIYSRRFTKYSFNEITIGKYIKPCVVLGGYGILTSLYTTFNVSFLGFVSNDLQVGYYTVAIKLYSIFLAFFTAFTGVMMPRMSALVANNELLKFKEALTKSSEILIMFSIPIIIFSSFFARDIIYLIAGDGYSGSVVPFRIIVPLVFIIGYEQILVIQILMPLRRDSIVFRNSLIGAALSIVLNILLVDKFKAIGSAIVWVSCESVILFLSQIVVSRSLDIKFPYKKISHCLVLFMPMGITYYIAIGILGESIYLMFAAVIWTIIYFIIVQLYFFPTGIVATNIHRISKTFFR